MTTKINYYIMPGLKQKPLKPAFIIEFVSHYLGYDYDDVILSGRQRKFSMARNMCYNLIRYNTELTLMDIARLFRKDHTTIMHGLRIHEHDMKTDQLYAENFNEIVFLLKLEPQKNTTKPKQTIYVI